MTLLQAVAINAPSSSDWILRTLAGSGIALAGWALARSVKHGEQLQHLQTFTGADGKNGIAERVNDLKSDVADKLEDLGKSMHSMRNSLQSMALALAELKGELKERE